MLEYIIVFLKLLSETLFTFSLIGVIAEKLQSSDAMTCQICDSSDATRRRGEGVRGRDSVGGVGLLTGFLLLNAFHVFFLLLNLDLFAS